MEEDNIFLHLPFPSCDSGEEYTTLHSPFSMLKFLSLSSPMHQTDQRRNDYHNGVCRNSLVQSEQGEPFGIPKTSHILLAN